MYLKVIEFCIKIKFELPYIFLQSYKVAKIANNFNQNIHGNMTLVRPKT